MSAPRLAASIAISLVFTAIFSVGFFLSIGGLGCKGWRECQIVDQSRKTTGFLTFLPRPFRFAAEDGVTDAGYDGKIGSNLLQERGVVRRPAICRTKKPASTRRRAPQSCPPRQQQHQRGRLGNGCAPSRRRSPPGTAKASSRPSRGRPGLVPLPDADSGGLERRELLSHDILVCPDRNLPHAPAALVPVRLFR